MENLTVSHVFTLIKERHSLKSDYQVCGMLDLSTALVSGWRNGRTLPDERMCQKLAVAAGIDPLVLAASMQAQRSKTDEARSMWQAIAERLQMAAQGAAAAIFAVVIAMGFVADDAYAQSAAPVSASQQAQANRLYIVSSKLRLWYCAV
jgi:hypothetical protein